MTDYYSFYECAAWCCISAIETRQVFSARVYTDINNVFIVFRLLQHLLNFFNPNLILLVLLFNVQISIISMAIGY